MTEQPIVTRTEILFLYDITDANPNGDPNDENRPRIDPETGRAKVTDVRLKRTIRDYLHDYCEEEIFCREIEKEDGTIQEGKDRAEDFFKAKANSVFEKRNLIQQKVIEKCIDVRLFGGTIPVSATKKNEKDSSVTLTGPVQFAMGTSLHRVESLFIKGTGAFASGQGKEQRTFREEYVLPYALIGFYGIVNQKAAETTRLTAADAEKLFEAIWYGTKNLITRSKMGQRPLLLLLVEYTSQHANSYIGRLDRFLDVTRGKSGGVLLQTANGANGSEIRDEELRDVTQVQLNLGTLQEALSRMNSKISKIRFVWDERLQLSHQPTEAAKKWTFLGSPAERLEFA
jgi:CRISPR-associated protein Csh2